MTAKIHLPAIINHVRAEITPHDGSGVNLRRASWRYRLDQTGTILSHIEAARAYEALRGMTSARRINLINLEA